VASPGAPLPWLLQRILLVTITTSKTSPFAMMTMLSFPLMTMLATVMTTLI
jgi:hypothetical protein